MKLGKIILPLNDNAGTPLVVEHAELRLKLVDRFGGFTAYEGLGGWLNNGSTQTEPVMIYDVAMHQDQSIALRNMAIELCINARQQSVMIQCPDGNVEFVSAGA